MKNNFLIIASAAFMLTFSSCTSCGNKQKSRESQIEEFQSQLTKEDTTTMFSLCDNAMELLKAKQYDRVLDNLFEYNDSTKEVKHLTDQTRKQYLAHFKMFPVLDYHRCYFSFQLEGCNDVKYKIVWATAEQAGTEEAPTIAFMFNPVKIDGVWHLCVKTPTDQFDREKL